MAPTQVSMEDQKPLQRTSSTTRAGSTTKNWGHLETSKAAEPVWLMKCPPNVAKSFKPHSAEDGAASEAGGSGPVAKVILSLDPLNSNNEPKFTMELAATESANTPKCYVLDVSRDFVPMSVFSESLEGKLSVEGKIFNKFDMKPHDENLESYGKLCRERTKTHMKCRKIQVIDNDNGAHMRPMPGMIGSVARGPNDKKRVPTKGSEMKRTRRDRGEMEDIMFKLFERQPNWTLRQLIQETDQPEQFLKDILKDLSVYNNKGANQGTYELKPEYRRSSEDAAP